MNERLRDLLDTALLLLYVYAAGWLAGTVLSSALSQLLLLVPGLSARLALGLEIGAISLAAAAKYFAGGFIYRLLARGDWRRAGLWTWAFFVAVSVIPQPGLLRLLWFYWRSAVGLAGALYGARNAYENESSPGVEGLRQLLLSVVGS